MVFTLSFVVWEILSKTFTFSLLFHTLTTEHSGAWKASSEVI